MTQSLKSLTNMVSRPAPVTLVKLVTLSETISEHYSGPSIKAVPIGASKEQQTRSPLPSPESLQKESSAGHLDGQTLSTPMVERGTLSSTKPCTTLSPITPQRFATISKRRRNKPKRRKPVSPPQASRSLSLSFQTPKTMSF